MSNTLSKVLNIILLVLMAVTVILAVMFYVKVAPAEEITANLMKYINWFMVWGVILIILVIFFAVIVGPIIEIINNPKTIIKGAISLVFLGIIIAIGFAMSKVEDIHLAEEVTNLATRQKVADTALFSMYILAGLGIVAIIFSEIKSFLKF